MIMVSEFSNFPDELNKNDELREFELSGSDCNVNQDLFSHLLISLSKQVSLRIIKLLFILKWQIENWPKKHM